jgi:hypothetical protein
MKKRLIPGLTLAAAFAIAAVPAAAEDRRDGSATADQLEEPGQGPDSFVIAFEEEPSHIFLTQDEYDRAIFRTPLARRSANMTYHGGKIMPTAVTKAIFWGPSWTNAAFAGDKIAGLDSWYSGHSVSNYAKTVDEYTGTNGQVGATTTHQGHIIDTSTATGGGSTSAILAEVCKQVTAGNIVPDGSGNGYYPVYTDVKRGNAGYCAWHSAGSCGGKVVQFAFFFNLDGDAGCDPADSTTGHSQGLAALANVTAHELSEARSDPASPGAWYDSSGAENGDKCAWTFNVPSVTFPNGTKWKLQGEWSNAAYTAGTGYPNSSGQRGCLDGH